MKYLLSLLILLPLLSQAQSVGIGTTSPDLSAILEIRSTSKGLLIPQMKATHRNAITKPATGLLVWQTDEVKGFYFNVGTPQAPDWQILAGSASAWMLDGNAGTNPANNFVGTTDNTPLRFRVRNVWSGSIDSTGGTYIGYRAGQNDALGNTAFGSRALSLNDNGAALTAIGRSALEKNRGGYGNTAIGTLSMQENTTGGWKTAVGTQSLLNNTTGDENVAIGMLSMYDNKGNKNVAAGVYTLSKNEGFNNAAFGHNALQYNTSGSWNVGISSSALKNNSTGIGNIAIGVSSMLLNDTGNANVAIGIFALTKSLTDNNTAVGARTLDNNISGDENTAIGTDALGENSTGSHNTALGYHAGDNNYTGNYNTFMGYNADVSGVRINATAVGYSAFAECSNCLVLGSVDGKNGSNVTTKVGVATTSPQYPFQVGSESDGSVAVANSWTTFSDVRYKENIATIDHALDKIDNLNGYYYTWKNGDDKSRQAGLLAQDVEKVLPEIVNTNEQGYKSVDYGKMNALLLQALKEQNDLIKTLQQRLEKLESKK